MEPHKCFNHSGYHEWSKIEIGIEIEIFSTAAKRGKLKTAYFCRCARAEPRSQLHKLQIIAFVAVDKVLTNWK